MQVEVTTSDEDAKVIYEVPGYPVKVITEPSEEHPEYVFVEIWDEAGCSARETRPADQAQSVALRTLFNEYRQDKRDLAEV